MAGRLIRSLIIEVAEMSEPAKKPGLNHDTAARIILLSPGELSALVRDGHVRRNGPNDYALPVLIQDYLGHLKADAERRETRPTQAEIASHLDLSDRAVREFQAASGLDHRQATLSENRITYIRRQREIAAGRATSEDGLDLATERAHLARAQREKVDMQNAVTRGELAPKSLLTEALVRIAPKICGQLESIVPALRRRSGYKAEDLDYINSVIAETRNAIAALRLDEASNDENEDDETIDGEYGD